MQYRDEGYLPEALINYLVRLGWAHGDQESFTRAEMTTLFDIKDVHAAAAAINPKKLLWLNQHYIKTLPAADIAERLRPFLIERGAELAAGPALTDVVVALQERAKTLVEMAEQALFFYREQVTIDDPKNQAILANAPHAALTALAEAFSSEPTWTRETVHATFETVAASHGLTFGKLAQPVRIAVTGSSVSPPIDVTCALLGRERCVTRLKLAVALAFREARP